MRNFFLVATICLLAPSVLFAAQEAQVPAETKESSVDAPGATKQAKTVTDATRQRVESIAADTTKQVEQIARKVDESEQARKVSAGVLQPIYALAELLAFPAFHWLAFAIMVAGVVSFALQLVLTKLILLAKLSFNMMEVLSDAMGLVVSLVGLVLTTQAAAENSTFTESPAAVLSATAVGAVVGFVFYLWGQSQELKAAKAQQKES